VIDPALDRETLPPRPSEKILDAARFAHRVGMTGTAMTTADEPMTGMPAARRNDPTEAILDHQTSP